MENATKALMIAGAVLIAIMIIGVGMMIFSSSNDILNESLSGMDKYAIDQFNNTFLPYEGTKKGSQLKQLISDIITLNATNLGVNDYKIVTATVDGTGGTTAEELRNARTALVSGKNYNVTLGYDTNNSGLITTVTITSADGGSSNT